MLTRKTMALLWTPLFHILTRDLDNLDTEGRKKITLRSQALKGFICRLAGGYFLGENERSLSRAVSSEREVGVVPLRRGSRSFAAFELQSVWIVRRQ